MGTPDNLHKASTYVQSVQSLQGLQISNVEEIAFRKNWISKKNLLNLTKKMKNSNYKKYLLDLINY